MRNRQIIDNTDPGLTLEMADKHRFASNDTASKTSVSDNTSSMIKAAAEDVIIIGAGVVGLTLAHGLKQVSHISRIWFRD